MYEMITVCMLMFLTPVDYTSHTFPKIQDKALNLPLFNGNFRKIKKMLISFSQSKNIYLSQIKPE